jgi:hypothetical protein
MSLQIYKALFGVHIHIIIYCSVFLDRRAICMLHYVLWYPIARFKNGQAMEFL